MKQRREHRLSIHIALTIIAGAALMLFAGCEYLIPAEDEPGSLYVSPSSVTMEVGGYVVLTVESANSEESYAFESADANVASVDATGAVRGLQQGVTSIAVTATMSGQAAEVPVTVTESTVDASNNPVVISTVRVDDGSVPYVEATLADGRTVYFDDLQHTLALGARAPDWSTPDTDVTPSALGSTARALSSGRSLTAPSADRISLTGDQTLIRNQAARGLCVSHAVLAAMEAQYKRLGYGNLDLSEQFAQHLSKMQSLVDRTDSAPPSAEGFENQLAMGGGGNTAGMIPLLMFYGVPEEQHHPYIGIRSYEDYTQPGDSPTLIWNDWATGTYSQELVNSYNTEHNRITINIPGTFGVTPLPLEALENATYGITGYRKASASDVTDPVWYENELSRRREIIIGMNWITETDDDTDILMPRNKKTDESDAGHAVLIVGYDRRDPDNKYFIVKNSWGPAGSRSFTKLSYDFLNTSLDGRIFQAAVLTGVKDPYRGGFIPTMALGRWNIRYDGLVGRLDIHRRDGVYPAIHDDVQVDNRLGIFYDAAGNAYRVNGTMDTNGRIEFYIDFDNPERDYEQLTGTKFVGYVSPGAPRLMTGTYSPLGSTQSRSFYASKEDLLTGESRETSLSHEAFLGSWQIESALLEGAVEIREVDAPADSFTGRLVDASGWVAISGSVDPTMQEISFNVPPSTGISAGFIGYIHGNRLDTIAGVLNADTEYSVALIRTGPAVTEIHIDEPTDRATFRELYGKGVSVDLQATLTADGEILGDDPNEGNPFVIWTTGAPYQQPGATVISNEGATGSATLFPGTHTIFVYHDIDVTDSVTITILDSDGPTVTISDPSDGYLIDDSTNAPDVFVTVSGSAEDTVDGVFSGKYLYWSYREDGETTWTPAGTGSSVTLELEDTQCNVTYYEIRLEATDSDGNVGTAIIRIGVRAWMC